MNWTLLNVSGIHEGNASPYNWQEIRNSTSGVKIDAAKAKEFDRTEDTEILEALIVGNVGADLVLSIINFNRLCKSNEAVMQLFDYYSWTIFLKDERHYDLLKTSFEHVPMRLQEI